MKALQYGFSTEAVVVGATRLDRGVVRCGTAKGQRMKVRLTRVLRGGGHTM
jgi:hypothetical protein